MRLSQLVEKLRRRDLNYFLDSPYVRNENLGFEDIDEPWQSLQDSPTLEQIEPLILADLSKEIAAISANSFQPLTDAEASNRAQTAYNTFTLEPGTEGLNITNRDRFPDVDWLEADEIQVIGTIGGTILVQLGTEQGTDVPVVAKVYTADSISEQLFAIPLYELMSHSQEPIRIESGESALD